MPGSKVKLWKQDPTVTPIDTRAAFIHTSVEDGPGDLEVTVHGMPTVYGSADRDFLFDSEENPKEFDSVNTL